METPTDNATVKTASEKKPSKPKKASNSAKKPKRAISAMEAAMMDMEIEPYNPGDEVIEEADIYGYDIGW